MGISSDFAKIVKSLVSVQLFEREDGSMTARQPVAGSGISGGRRMSRSRTGSKFEHSVSMLAWAFNEHGLVRDFLDRAFDLLEKNIQDYELVFVDDG